MTEIVHILNSLEKVWYIQDIRSEIIHYFNYYFDKHWWSDMLIKAVNCDLLLEYWTGDWETIVHLKLFWSSAVKIINKHIFPSFCNRGSALLALAFSLVRGNDASFAPYCPPQCLSPSKIAISFWTQSGWEELDFGWECTWSDWIDVGANCLWGETSSYCERYK